MFDDVFKHSYQVTCSYCIHILDFSASKHSYSRYAIDYYVSTSLSNLPQAPFIWTCPSCSIAHISSNNPNVDKHRVLSSEADDFINEAFHGMQWQCHDKTFLSRELSINPYPVHFEVLVISGFQYSCNGRV